MWKIWKMWLWLPVGIAGGVDVVVFADGDVLRRLFESVVEKCIGFGIVGGTDAAIDGSTIEADANRDRKDTPDAVQKVWLGSIPAECRMTL